MAKKGDVTSQKHVTACSALEARGAGPRRSPRLGVREKENRAFCGLRCRNRRF